MGLSVGSCCSAAAAAAFASPAQLQPPRAPSLPTRAWSSRAPRRFSAVPLGPRHLRRRSYATCCRAQGRASEESAWFMFQWVFYSFGSSKWSAELLIPPELSSKTMWTPDRELGQFEDLVASITNFHNEDKGFMVLDGDVFDVPIRKDIVPWVVRGQLAKTQQGTHSTKTIREVIGTGKSHTSNNKKKKKLNE